VIVSRVVFEGWRAEERGFEKRRRGRGGKDVVRFGRGREQTVGVDRREVLRVRLLGSGAKKREGIRRVRRKRSRRE